LQKSSMSKKNCQISPVPNPKPRHTVKALIIGNKKKMQQKNVPKTEFLQL